MTYYQILGIEESATQEEIKAARNRLSKKYHPDVYIGDKEYAEQKTKQINEAYETLSDPTLKEEYDEKLHPKAETAYQYTPPKYNNPESYSYKNYYTNSKYNNYNDENFRRYTSYNRTNGPSSNYHDQMSNNIANSFSKVSFKAKLLIILVVLIIYFALFINTFFKFNSIYSGNGKKSELQLPASSSTSTSLPENTEQYDSKTQDSPPNNFDSDFENFDINDYFTEDQLRSVYYEYYKDTYPTYSDFRKELTAYIYYRLYEN